MMLLGHLMLIPGPLVMLSSAPDLRKMLPSHLEVLHAGGACGPAIRLPAPGGRGATPR